MRIAIKEALNKRIAISRKHKQHINILFDGLKDLLELTNKTNACTATYSSVILRHPIFIELVEFIREKDPSKYECLEDLIKSAEAFYLSE